MALAEPIVMDCEVISFTPAPDSSVSASKRFSEREKPMQARVFAGTCSNHEAPPRARSGAFARPVTIMNNSVDL